jgi:glutamate 5-kinase
VNENDPISTEEMREVGRWADNDRNALLLAKLFKAKMIILVTNTDGVYANASDPESRIQNIDSSIITDAYISSLCDGKSTNWTGGMWSKLSVAHEAGKIGITTHIGNGTHSGIHNQDISGTTIFPSKK